MSSSKASPQGPARRPSLGWLFWLSVGWVALTILLSILANLLPLPNPNLQNYAAINQSPSWTHLLGTDDLGRDILSRTVYGSRVSLIVGFGAIAIGLGIGGTLGMVSGYRRGATDTLLNAASYVLLAFPALVAVMAIVTFWGHELWKITVVVGIASSPLAFRIVRAATLSVASREFVTAARAQGASSTRVLFREILPNILPLVVSFSLLGVAAVIVLEGSLAFLGLSVPVSTPSWGNMLNEGRNYLQVNPWLTVFPASAMFLFLLALNYVGDGLRQHFDVLEVKL
ncbi:MAG: ABC transporter permease [Acidimicrobiales bacterium]|nr:ABC transporter permease [Actinomycetota bacterium]